MNHSLTVLGAMGAICLLFSGCSLFQGAARISLPGGGSVQAPKDNGSPATVAQSNAGASIALAAGSVVTVTKFEALPATKDAPAQPAKEVTEIRPSAPTEYHHTESKTAASTGTIDTSVREHQIDAQENRVLLYGALLMLVGSGVFFWLKYPSPALMCAGGAVILFLCWKLAGLPEWFWGIAVLAGAGGVGLYFGHHRGLYEPVPDDKPKA